MTIHSAVIQKLLSKNAHLGKRVAAHHFKIYTYGARNGMNIIDSDKTLICICNACHFISNLARHNAKFLFVNTNSLCDEIVDQMTMRIGCGADSSWKLSGFLTNSGSPKKFREESENLKQSMMSSSKDEDLVIPCESLALTSDDPVETKQLLGKLAVIKLNGALGTKMGFSRPMFAIVVCNGVTYLDLIINQIESINSNHGCNVPLILMNTIGTHDGTMKAVEKFSQKNVDILPLCQSQSHRVRRGKDSEDELDLFDHRELFLSLKSSATLESLLLQLSEIVQMPGKHSREKSKLVDTSNLRMNLKVVKRLVETNGQNVENYPLSKSFDRAIGINVPHSHFQPMMSISDLFIFQSDLYSYAEGFLIQNGARTNSLNPCFELGPEFEKLSGFQSRFKSIPSIIDLDSLKVMGDVWFGTGITFMGKVKITAKDGEKLEIPAGVVLENKEISDPSDT